MQMSSFVHEMHDCADEIKSTDLFNTFSLNWNHRTKLCPIKAALL